MASFQNFQILNTFSGYKFIEELSASEIATNGYSNDYWDWGMEDDDLFWRCHIEGLTNDTYLKKDIKQKYLRFDGQDSYAKIPFSRSIRGITSKSHTFSILTRAFQQPEKKKIFLIGDKTNEYIEYPILRIPGYDYGISFNNSRALSLTFWNNFDNHNYMWVKRYDNQWSWVTVVIDTETKTSQLYLNGTEVDSKGGYGSPSPLKWIGKLKQYGPNPIYLGYTPSLHDDCGHKYLKGDIAKVYGWKRALTVEEIKDLHNNIPSDDIVVDLDINNPKTDLETFNTVEHNETINIPNSILPYRREGRFRCLPHEDEGLVDGKWAKGETTAKNEERYVLKMQNGKVDHKKDGIKQLSYKLIEEKILTPWAKMLNITL